MSQSVDVTSEIGQLKTAILHRPGRELENITPDRLNDLLFDDIPDLELAQRQHDKLVAILQSRGVETLYIDQLVTEALANDELREEFVESVVSASKQGSRRATETLKTFLLDLPTHAMVRQVIAGVRKDDILLPSEHYQQLHDMIEQARYPFYLDPMPNLYLSRDAMVAVDRGVAIGKMKYPIRRRESLLAEYFIKHHPQFTVDSTPTWYDRQQKFSFEGGDLLVLSPESVMIGISSRTTAESVELIAIELLEKTGAKRVIAIELPTAVSRFRLNSMISMIDHDKFILNPKLRDHDGKIRAFLLEKTTSQRYPRISKEVDLDHLMRVALASPQVTLIDSSDDEIVASREQWHGASGVLALSPGVVVAYDCNRQANQRMRQSGVEVIEIPGSELLSGRGSLHSLVVPIVRG